jgi:hypothetical protein
MCKFELGGGNMNTHEIDVNDDVLDKWWVIFLPTAEEGASSAHAKGRQGGHGAGAPCSSRCAAVAERHRLLQYQARDRCACSLWLAAIACQAVQPYAYDLLHSRSTPPCRSALRLHILHISWRCTILACCFASRKWCVDCSTPLFALRAKAELAAPLWVHPKLAYYAAAANGGTHGPPESPGKGKTKPGQKPLFLPPTLRLVTLLVFPAAAISLAANYTLSPGATLRISTPSKQH